LIPSTRARTEHSPAALDLVFIEGFRGDTIIGIHDGEFDRPQPLLIDVIAGLPQARAGRAGDSDRIADTIDYSVVRLRLRRLLAEHRLQLLEAFAEAVADILLGEFGAAWVRVTVVKPNKFDDVKALGVQIECSAVSRPTTGRSAAVLQLLGSGMVPGGR
jgi:7,8-dihydroneopterin aldolase/epimerase/oxygenase